jgi:hypothetical protein
MSYEAIPAPKRVCAYLYVFLDDGDYQEARNTLWMLQRSQRCHVTWREHVVSTDEKRFRCIVFAEVPRWIGLAARKARLGCALTTRPRSKKQLAFLYCASKRLPFRIDEGEIGEARGHVISHTPSARTIERVLRASEGLSDAASVKLRLFALSRMCGMLGASDVSVLMAQGMCSRAFVATRDVPSANIVACCVWIAIKFVETNVPPAWQVALTCGISAEELVRDEIKVLSALEWRPLKKMLPVTHLTLSASQ